ncbi:MAG: dockerin type I domain-containing protein, partial [Verrucomicrobiota bacterium]|nr:dockerin type I domain-containing protein [Verrucomicrobiota bacterium]
FLGVGAGLAGFSPSSNPPDVNGRVGATQYVQWNNTSFAVFNKNTGALQYGPAAGNTLFRALGGVCASHNDGDPVVSYDILSGRWVLSQFVVGAGQTSYSHQCFAVSTTSDATGEYYLYDFVTDPVNFVDYPHTAVWPDGYYMSTHVFNATSGTFTTGRIYVFERQKMIYGLPARMQSSDLGLEYGFLPADLDSLTPPAPGEAEFLLGPNEAADDLTDSYRVMVTWDPAPTIVLTRGQIPGGIGSAPCVNNSNGRDCVPQPAPATGVDYLDNIAGHLMYRLAYRNQGTQAAPQESLVVSGPSVGSATTPAHGAVEWFEFRNAGSSATQPTLFQSGTFDPDTDYRWMPSISMDKDGNMALGYSKSSTTVKPGIYLTGRLATDPVNTMGAEVEMQPGLGVQLGGGNRWGDYSAMTLDPIDQCTFFYTNEYLPNNGQFNWSTRIASYKFGSCASAANLYGTVTGIVSSAETGAPISGVTVTLNNGYAGATNAAGVYTILVPAGSYTATAADPARNCATASPASATVIPPGGGTVYQNFTIAGGSKLDAASLTIDDSLGNNNQIVNRGECVRVNLGLKNNGCATEKAISATLTTTTPGVTIDQGTSNYPDLVIDAGATNITPFRISVSNGFVCGTQVALSLNLTYAGGTKSIPFSVPTCAGGPDQAIPSSQLTTSDATQTDRVGRTGQPSTCSGKAAPGGGFTGTHYYKTFTFNNSSGAPRCYTVTINAGLNGPGDIESVAYDQTYDPTMIDANYLGDSGISGLGRTVSQASYSFNVPAGHNFVVVVNTTGSATSGTIASAPFSGTVSGFVNNTAGPGDCSTVPPIPALVGAAVRLTHGSAGTFDTTMPLNGGGVEPRLSGGNYTAVLHFDRAVQGGSASVTGGSGTVTGYSFSGNDMLVELSGVADQQRLTLTATNVAGSTGGGVLASAGVTMGFLVGDTNGDSTVNAADATQTRNVSGQLTNPTNYRTDVNRDGAINTADATVVRNRASNALPPTAGARGYQR